MTLTKKMCAATAMLALVLPACGGSDGTVLGGADSEQGASRTSDDMAVEGAPDGSASGGAQETFASAQDEGQVGTAAQLPSIGPSVIKTGSVTVKVEEGSFKDSLQGVIATARAHGGFVLSTDVGGEDARSGTLVIRVPSARFEQVLSEVEDLGELAGESISGQDVSQEFIDLEARARNLRAQEAVLLRLMDRAVSIADTIRVQGELQGVQLEIERIRGQLRYLEDQTSLGTLTVSLQEKGAAPVRAGTIDRALEQALGAALGVVAAVIVGAGAVLPVAVLIAVVLLIVRQLRPRLFTAGPDPS
ncbi:MAG: DUF4349 domain-containing protein [Actinobacteria bacterium]|nr:DUF4349 domain-containing protein [Actinomycetota bacterium]